MCHVPNNPLSNGSIKVAVMLNILQLLCALCMNGQRMKGSSIYFCRTLVPKDFTKCFSQPGSRTKYLCKNERPRTTRQA